MIFPNWLSKRRNDWPYDSLRENNNIKKDSIVPYLEKMDAERYTTTPAEIFYVDAKQPSVAWSHGCKWSRLQKACWQVNSKGRALHRRDLIYAVSSLSPSDWSYSALGSAVTFFEWCYSTQESTLLGSARLGFTGGGMPPTMCHEYKPPLRLWAHLDAFCFNSFCIRTDDQGWSVSSVRSRPPSVFAIWTQLRTSFWTSWADPEAPCVMCAHYVMVYPSATLFAVSLKFPAGKAEELELIHLV